jgi:integrase
MHYLHRRDGVYYYRQRLPQQLGYGSIAKSLKTKDQPTAKHLLKLISYNVSLLFYKYQGSSVSVDLIRSVVSQYIDWVLQEHERNQADKPLRSLESIEDYVKTLENAQGDLLEAMVTNDQRQAEANLQFFTSSNPNADIQDIQQGTPEHRQLLREILKADVEIGEEVIRRTTGDYSSSFNQSYSDMGVELIAVNSAVRTQEPKARTKLASEVLAEFIQDRTITKGWTDKTADSTRNRLEGFLYIIGDKPVTSYTRDDIYSYRLKVQQLPLNMNKYDKFNDKGIDEVIALNTGGKVISTSTVNKHLMWVRSFFDWMATNQLIPHNVAKDVNIAKKANPLDARSPFTKADLSVLFGRLEEYSGGLHKTLISRPERVWIPLIGLYHGMRLNEICQLFEDDIIDIEGIPCIRIIENEARLQHVKNNGSRRTIPIHPKLIEIGFLEYVLQMRKVSPKAQLFPLLTPTRDGYGKNMTYWFNNTVLNKLGLKGGAKKDFHSFRHTVIDEFKNSDARLEHYQAIIGHSSGTITLDTYGSSLRPSKMLETLKLIDYSIPELQAFEEHLKALMLK